MGQNGTAGRNIVKRTPLILPWAAVSNARRQAIAAMRMITIVIQIIPARNISAIPTIPAPALTRPAIPLLSAVPA